MEIDFDGYASLSQLGTGLRQRIYSRAFIITNPNNPGDTIVYLVLDNLTGDTSIRYGVLQGLKKLGKEYNRYGERNIALTGTHSHSGPGAWNNYLLPQIPTKGFDKQSFQAIVDGALLSIKRAHESIAPGRLSFGSIHLEDANINRSPWSYEANPEEERARYSADVDKTMTMLKFDRESDNKTSAVLTFFPVHGTSMYNNNTLVSPDYKCMSDRQENEVPGSTLKAHPSPLLDMASSLIYSYRLPATTKGLLHGFSIEASRMTRGLRTISLPASRSRMLGTRARTS